MRTIGKIATLAMMLSLTLVLTACGGNASSSAASASASASAASNSTAASSASASTSSATSSSAATADTYENEFFGIAFNLPKGWSFTDTKTLQGINSVIATASQNAELDMVAMNADQSQIVIVSIEAPDSANTGMTAEKYLEAQNEQVKSALDGNYTYSTVSATITFEGISRELPASITTLNVNGTQLCICQAVAEKDGYFFNAIAMGANQDEVSSAFENFKAAV